MILETRAPRMRSASRAAREAVRLSGATVSPNTEFFPDQQAPETGAPELSDGGASCP